MYPDEPLPNHAYDTPFCREMAAEQEAYIDVSDEQGTRLVESADVLVGLLDERCFEEVHMNRKKLAKHRRLVEDAFEHLMDRYDEMEDALESLEERFR